MSVDQRNVVRLLVPPLLALGLVAVVTSPMDASSMPSPIDVPRPVAQPAPVAAPATVSTTALAVDIPVVSLPREVRAVHGTIRVPVLLADPTVVGRAVVLPSRACSIDLVQGVVGWLTCSAGRGTVVRVELSDGRVFQTVVR
jgi:hypothetical protein